MSQTNPSSVPAARPDDEYLMRDNTAHPPAYAPVVKFPVKVESDAVWTRDDRG